MKPKEFYAEIGRLLYAMAYIDGAISKQEYAVVLRKIKDELIPSDPRSDEFGTPLPHYIETEFDFQADQSLDAEAAYESFTNYITEHYSAFDQRTLRVCMHLARAVARAFHQTNKQEKKLLLRLKSLIDRLAPLIPAELIVHESI